MVAAGRASGVKMGDDVGGGTDSSDGGSIQTDCWCICLCYLSLDHKI